MNTPIPGFYKFTPAEEDFASKQGLPIDPAIVKYISSLREDFKSLRKEVGKLREEIEVQKDMIQFLTEEIYSLREKVTNP